MAIPFAPVWSNIAGPLDWVGWVKPASSRFENHSADRWGIAGFAMISPCWRDRPLGPAQPAMGFPRQGPTGLQFVDPLAVGVMVGADGRWIGELGRCLGCGWAALP